MVDPDKRQSVEMITYGRKQLNDLADGKASLVRLTHESYEPAQIREIISVVGAKTELFLKSVALPGRNTRNSFQWFIDQLATFSVAAISLGKLHSLRLACNVAKHEPMTAISLLDAIRIVDDAHEAVDEIVTKAVGSVDRFVHPHTHRVFWIAVFDHYVDGDSEVHVILPDESNHWLGPPTFDIVNVSISGWDSIVATLPQVGGFRNGKGLIPDAQYKSFNTDADFLDAWVFEGDYRSLITTLAQYELRQDLLSGLNRHDNSGSMILAFLLASLDLIGGVANARDLSALIVGQATNAYAVPPDYKHSRMLADGMGELFGTIPVSEWSRITGPLWMREAEFDIAAPMARAKHPKYDIIIDQALTVRILVEIRKETLAKLTAEADENFELQLERLREKMKEKAANEEGPE